MWKFKLENNKNLGGWVYWRAQRPYFKARAPRCPSSSFQMTVVVVQGLWLSLVHCQPGWNRQPHVAVDFRSALLGGSSWCWGIMVAGGGGQTEQC